MDVRAQASPRRGALRYTVLFAVAIFLAVALRVAVAQEKPSAAAAATVAKALSKGGDPLAGLPPYLPKAPVSGELKLAGSSAMNQLALLWADGLKHMHPEAKVNITMYESAQVLPRLASGEMQIGLMSRPLTEKEIKESGVVALATAKDVLGIVVHPDNPLQQLTQQQGVQILCDPAAKDMPGAKTWGDLGVTGKLADQPIHLYGRTSGTGAWGYLVNRFLGEGAKTRTSKDCNGYAAIVENVAKDPAGVGYLSLALSPPKAGKVLPLVLTTGEVIPPPKYGQEVDPRYPLVRQLYVVMKVKPGEKLPPMTEEFLRYVLSRSGQEDAIKSGMLPLRRDEVVASRDQLGWTGVH